MISDKIPGRWKKGSAVVMCQRCKHRMDDHTFGPGINVNPRVACSVCVTHNGGECCIRNATSAEISRKKPLPYKENAIVLEPGTTYCEVVRICHPSEPGEMEIVSQYVPHEEVPVGEANAFVRQHHRHHRPDSRNRFAIAVARSGTVCGVALVGNPRARMLQDGWTCEVTRCATDGTQNACSKLYSAAWRAAQQLGFRRCVTYILDTEHGASLNAAGWRCIGKAGGGSWSRRSRPRVDEHPTQGKIRFEVHR